MRIAACCQPIQTEKVAVCVFPIPPQHKSGMAKKQKARRDIYQEVTNQIIDCLEAGTAPWRNPIAGSSGNGLPKNLQTGKAYRGVNVLLLSMRAWATGYASEFWMTYKQAKAKGGQVRKGEKGSLVTFWKMHETKDRENGEPKILPVLRHYTAFNLEQIDGIEKPDAPEIGENSPPFEPLSEADAIIRDYTNPPAIKHDGGQRAFYRVKSDSVHLPEPNQFDNRENYYSTLFHELSHSTGVAKRLNRGIDTDPVPFGSPDYSREELVAEISAAYLCAASGISPTTIEQSAAYLQGWINVLKGDKRLVVSAAGAAQKSADLILGASFNQAGSRSKDSSRVASQPDTQLADHRLNNHDQQSQPK